MITDLLRRRRNRAVPSELVLDRLAANVMIADAD